MRKWEFEALLRKIDISKTWYFYYNGACTDPMTSRYWVSHMAQYIFSIHCQETGEEIILEQKKTSKPHFDLEQLLRKRYTKWAVNYKKNHLTKGN